MARKSTKPSINRREVLVLHGGDEHLARQFVEVLQAQGLQAGRIVDFPSHGRPQNDRVRVAIRAARLVLAIATFDGRNSFARQPRANLTGEIAWCQETNPRALIVLAETRNNKMVDLGSNIDKSVVAIPFSRRDALEVMPPLIRELQSRGLMLSERTPAEDMTTFRALNTFLESMNRLWVEELDEAWDAVYLIDPYSERLCNLLHDRFHEILLDVVFEHLRERYTRNELAGTCRTAIRDSEEIALQCWDSAAEGRLRMAQSKIADCRHKSRAADHKLKWEDLNRQHWKMKNARKDDFKTRCQTRRELVERITTFTEGIR